MKRLDKTEHKDDLAERIRMNNLCSRDAVSSANLGEIEWNLHFAWFCMLVMGGGSNVHGNN